MMKAKVTDRRDVCCGRMGCRNPNRMGRLTEDGELTLRMHWHWTDTPEPPRWVQGRRRNHLEGDMVTAGWKEPEGATLAPDGWAIEIPTMIECPRCHAVQEVSPALSQ